MSRQKLGSAWTDFGWQAISFEVPLGWDLGLVSGDHRSGYCRLDDEDMVRLEARWEETRGKIDIDRLVQKHLAEAQKEAKKKRARWSSKRNLKSVQLDGFDYEMFSFRGVVGAVGLVARCTECKRGLFVRVFHRSGEPIRGVAKRIFKSLRDHPRDGKAHWHIYDFGFDVPDFMRLHKHSLKTGRLELLFKKGKTELEFVRLSLGKIVLGEKDLGSWFSGFYEKQLHGFSRDRRKDVINEHGCLISEGRPSLGRRLRTLFSGRHDLYACVWRCEVNDKIYIFRTTAATDELEKLKKFANSIKCH